MIYPISLGVVALLAFVLYQNNSTKLMLIVLAIGGYIIYSHETGHTMTDMKNSAVDSIEESAEEFGTRYETDAYNIEKVK